MKTILRWDTISLPEGQRPDALSTTWHSANYARIDLRTTPAEDAGPWEPIGIVETPPKNSRLLSLVERPVPST